MNKKSVKQINNGWLMLMITSLLIGVSIGIVVTNSFKEEYVIPSDIILTYNNNHTVYVIEQKVTEEKIINEIKPQNTFQEVAFDVSNDYEYKAVSFDCTEFCDEVKLRLEQRGFTGLSRMSVTFDCGRSLKMDGYNMDRESCYTFQGHHDILKLGDFGYLECTNGFIISPKDYEKYGLVKK